ncbi:MAG: phosphoribosyltransferase [Candidatus Blackburnbacteria bacterium]|nr:phosphoribosyltransferase [Candidatus Blackburnbacteria bacterium]
MPEEAVLSILRQAGAVLTEDHFVYTSGKHGSAYVNKDAVYPDVGITDVLCNAIAHHFRDADVQTVVGPEHGGIVLQFATTLNLREQTNRNISGVYAENAPYAYVTQKNFVFKRGFDRFVKGKRVLIVDDVLTTGSSIGAVVNAVRGTGGEVVGVGVLCNRGGITVEQLGVPELFALCNVSLESWPEEDCPLCAQGVPVNTTIGKGRAFLARKQSA